MPIANAVTVETVRPDGARQAFAMPDRGGWLESAEAIPEPHAFVAHVRVAGQDYPVAFEELTRRARHDAHGAAAHRDNNMRAAVVHVLADAAVSVLVIVGLLLARAFGWLWMDPLAGIVGAFVIASWSWGLVRDTGAILLDMKPDRRVADGVRAAIEAEGDRVADLHLWRLGPGHLGAIVAVATAQPREAGVLPRACSRASLRCRTSPSRCSAPALSSKPAPKRTVSRTLKVAWGSLGVSVIVLAMKYAAYRLTGSIALYSDALETVINVVAAGGALIALCVQANDPRTRTTPMATTRRSTLSAVVEGAGWCWPPRS